MSVYWSKTCAACLLLFATSSPARGSTIYPEQLERGVGLSKAPECITCHATSRGGPNTARKPFALTLKRLGLEGEARVASLEAAIISAENQASDSDTDGATDVAELLAGTSPNDVDAPAPESAVPEGTWFNASAEEPESEPEPESAAGCGIAKRGDEGAAWAALLVIFAFALRTAPSASVWRSAAARRRNAGRGPSWLEPRPASSLQSDTRLRVAAGRARSRPPGPT